MIICPIHSFSRDLEKWDILILSLFLIIYEPVLVLQTALCGYPEGQFIQERQGKDLTLPLYLPVFKIINSFPVIFREDREKFFCLFVFVLFFMSL